MKDVKQKHGLDVGDLVRSKYEYPSGRASIGLILEHRSFDNSGKWAKVHWSYDGPALEKVRDLEVIL